MGNKPVIHLGLLKRKHKTHDSIIVNAKLSQTILPTYPAEEGEFSVDYRDYNGRVIIGSGEWLFETHWSSAGGGSIHIYNDPPSIRGVAVAPNAGRINDVTEAVFAAANFTSRSRHPRAGQVVLGVVQIRVTPKKRNPFTIKALLISGVTWKWHLLNHADVALHLRSIEFFTQTTDLHLIRRN